MWKWLILWLIIFASQGLRFGSPFSPPLADLEQNTFWISRAMPPGGLSKLRPLDSRHRQPIRIVLLYVCWRVENGSAQWRKLICDQFNLEALTVNQVKSFKALADGKDVFIGTKTGSGIFVYISSITCAPCKTSSDWIRVLVAVTNEI